MSRHAPGVAATLLAAALAAGPAAADEYHHHNFPLGEAAMGMGGAFAALAADATAGWYNPAGLGFLRGTTFSAQTSVYGRLADETLAGGGLRATDGGQYFTFPSTLGVARRLGRRHTLGLVVATPDFDSRSALVVADGGEFLGRPMRSLALVQDDRDSSLWGGLAYAVRAHSRVALGITLFGILRSRDLLTALHYEAEDGTFDAVHARFGILHLSLAALVGIRVVPVGGLTLGLTFRTPNLGLYGRASGDVVSPGAEGLESAAEELPADSRLPGRLTLGVAWSEPRRWAVEADVALSGAVGPYLALADSTLPEAAVRIEKALVVNAGAGAEYYPLRSLALRLGFFTNFSARPTLSPAERDWAWLGLTGILGGQGGVPDLYGFTAGVSWEPGALTLGVATSVSFGFGTTELGSARSERRIRELLVGLALSYTL